MRIPVVALLGTLLAACATALVPPAKSREAAVVVDPRIELMSVLQVLTDYPLTTYLDHSYKKEVRERFSAHSNHPAVATFRSMWKKEFRFSTVPEAIMAFTPPPELAVRRPLKAEILEGAGGQAQLDQLIAEMRDFVRASEFDRFFAQKQPYYARLISRTAPVVKSVIGPLEDYLGTELGDTTVVLGPLLHEGGFLSSYANDSGQPEIYAFIGPDKVVDGLPDFGTAERLEPLISHEFAHSVINPLTERHSVEVNARAAVFPPIAAKMKENGYGTWEQTVYEHVIRAITVRLTTRSRGEAAGKAALDEELKRGFVYVPALVRKLEEYERNRASYPTIGDYFPKLLTAFA